MNFFKSVFSDDPDPSETESESSDSPKASDNLENPEQSNPNEDALGWSFGGLMKTIATRSESVIETYRRDLEEFGTELKKEIEVAQGSLGTMGHAIDELGNTVLKSTAEIIAQGKEAILAAGNESDSSDTNSSRRDSFSSKPYSRFDAQIRSVQGDVNTYCEEVDDLDDYRKWESEFGLEDRGEEMERLFEENGDMKGVYKRVVPSVVDDKTFWLRYYYKVYKLKLAEDLRANLVKRAISLDDEEELSWDIDDEEENVDETTKEEENVENVTENTKEYERNDQMGSGDVNDDSVTEVRNVVSEEKKESSNEEVDAPFVQDSGKTETVVKPDEAPAPAPAPGPVQDSAKPDDVASSSTQQVSEEDMGWDEIEDMSSIDGKETSRSSGSPNRAELRKRLSVTEEDEDLSWDIEDDEEEESSKA